MAETDVVSRLTKDHKTTSALLTRMTKEGSTPTWEQFCELTNELIRHEVAEETIVYPVVRRTIGNGDRLADARIKEQAEAEELLARIEKEGPDSPSFVANIQKLAKAVLEHAAKEEELIFEPLKESLDADRRNQLGKAYEGAKMMAPTHPHPHAPDTPPGNMIAGPVAAIADRFRDAMGKVAS